MRHRFAALFSTSEGRDDSDAARQEVHDLVQWSTLAYTKRFLAELDRIAYAPLTVSDNHMAMVQSVTRANTYKEIRQDLMARIARAQEVLAIEKESRND